MPLLLVSVGLATAGFAGFFGTGGEIVGVVILLGGAILGLLVVYVLPVTPANFAATDRPAEAFAFSTIAGGAFTTDYFVAFVLAVMVGVVLGTIGALQSLILVGIFLLFYVNVIVYFIFARGAAPGLSNRA